MQRAVSGDFEIGFAFDQDGAGKGGIVSCQDISLVGASRFIAEGQGLASS